MRRINLQNIPGERLRFFKDWMQDNDLTVTKVAEKSGIWAPNIHRFFKNDDMRLQSLLSISSGFGNSLELHFSGKGNIIKDAVLIAGEGTSVESLMGAILGVCGNLTLPQFAEFMGVSRAGAQYIFKNASINLSSVYSLAEHYHFELNFSFVEK